MCWVNDAMINLSNFIVDFYMSIFFAEFYEQVAFQKKKKHLI